MKEFCKGCKHLNYDCHGAEENSVWTGCASYEQEEKRTEEKDKQNN